MSGELFAQFVSVIAAVAGVIAVAYVAMIGQKPLRDWWRERSRYATQPAPAVDPYAVAPLRHNLPQRPYTAFINRQAELAAVMRTVLDPTGGHSVVTITGTGGVGKTSLALQAAYRLVQGNGRGDAELFGSIIWCSAKQFVLTPVGIIRRSSAVQTLGDIQRCVAIFLQRRDIMQAPASDRDELIRELLTRHRVLLFIDNIETMEDDSLLAFLGELPAAAKAVVTARPRLGIGYPVQLTGMDPDDTSELAREESRSRAVQLTDAATRELYASTGGMPLAIVWSVAQLACGFDLNGVLRRLRRGDEDLVRFSFEGAVSGIRDTPAHRILMALSLFASDASRDALGSVAGLSDEQEIRDDGIATLLGLSLINQDNDRFSILPLTREYMSTELTARGEFTALARARMFAYMRDFVIDNLGDDYWQPIARWIDSIDVIEPEIENLLQCVRWAADEGNHNVVLQVGGALVHHLWRLARIEERRIVSELAAAAAEALDEHLWRVWLLVDGLGYIYLARQELDEAERVIDTGRHAAVRHGHADGEALALAYLAQIAASRGDFRRAVDLLGEATERATLYPVVARVKAVEGQVALYRQDWATAEAHYEEVIVARRRSDGYDPPTQLALLGLVQAQQGKRAAADQTLDLALGHQRQTTEGLGYASYGKAVISYAGGDLKSAERYLVDALAYLRRVGVQLVVAQVERLLADVRQGARRRWWRRHRTS